MSDIINNKLVSLWRGDKEPPTKYHIWIRNNKLLLFDGTEWVVFIDHFDSIANIKDLIKSIEALNNVTINNKKLLDNPVLSSLDILLGKDVNKLPSNTSIYETIKYLDDKFTGGYEIKVSDGEKGSILITVGNYSLSLMGSNAINVSHSGNNIIIDSNALTSIDAEKPLEYTKNNKLIHQTSGVEEGSYGTSQELNRASSFTVPNIQVDKFGHIKSATNVSVSIRDYVQQDLNNNDNTNRSLLLQEGSPNQANPVYISNGLTFNNKSLELNVPGNLLANKGIRVVGGDLVVDPGHKIKGELEGSISGSAKPKQHASKEFEYGPASTYLYGHVILQDVLGLEVPPLSNANKDINITDPTKGCLVVAASPYMVYTAREDAIKISNKYTDNLLDSTDFEKIEDKIYLKWENL